MMKKEPTSGMDPLSLLKQAIVIVPSVKYALGIVGIVAAIAIIKSFEIDNQIAISGTIIMFVLMAVLVIFSKVARFTQGDLRLPALVLTWFSLILMISTACALFLCIFANWPKGFQEVLRSLGTTLNESGVKEGIQVKEATLQPRTPEAPIPLSPLTKEIAPETAPEKTSAKRSATPPEKIEAPSIPAKVDAEPAQISMRKYIDLDLSFNDSIEKVRQQFSQATWGEKNGLVSATFPGNFLSQVPGYITIFLKDNKITQFMFYEEESGATWKQYKREDADWDLTRTHKNGEELTYQQAVSKCKPLTDFDIKGLFTREFGIATKTITPDREFSGTDDLKNDPRIIRIDGKGKREWQLEYRLENMSIAGLYMTYNQEFERKNSSLSLEKVQTQYCKLRIDFKRINM